MVADVKGSSATSRLIGTRFTEVRWFEEVGSTNADLLALAADGAVEGLVLVADHQTAGRGRLDRRWEALPGSSLLVSVLLRPQLHPDDTFLLTNAAAVAAARSEAKKLRMHGLLRLRSPQAYTNVFGASGRAMLRRKSKR